MISSTEQNWAEGECYYVVYCRTIQGSKRVMMRMAMVVDLIIFVCVISSDRKAKKVAISGICASLLDLHVCLSIGSRQS